METRQKSNEQFQQETHEAIKKLNAMFEKFMGEHQTLQLLVTAELLVLLLCEHVGKVSVEWLAGEKTKVAGTFTPQKQGPPCMWEKVQCQEVQVLLLMLGKISTPNTNNVTKNSELSLSTYISKSRPPEMHNLERHKSPLKRVTFKGEALDRNCIEAKKGVKERKIVNDGLYYSSLLIRVGPKKNMKHSNETWLIGSAIIP
ncbi:hypothetical protein Cgig2_018735 [Carnegiea gigantea]|uniref:Uncharacterized protein n=1 Tax=Carnegiea gigantea TaxID=171969 RepID=A0A9Q1GV04_9CARY|nr:hypothetical protein Cgig2_018735 [Carnegiea gigantea]